MMKYLLIAFFLFVSSVGHTQLTSDDQITLLNSCKSVEFLEPQYILKNCSTEFSNQSKVAFDIASIVDCIGGSPSLCSHVVEVSAYANGQQLRFSVSQSVELGEHVIVDVAPLSQMSDLPNLSEVNLCMRLKSQCEDQLGLISHTISENQCMTVQLIDEGETIEVVDYLSTPIPSSWSLCNFNAGELLCCYSQADAVCFQVESIPSAGIPQMVTVGYSNGITVDYNIQEVINGQGFFIDDALVSNQRNCITRPDDGCKYPGLTFEYLQYNTYLKTVYCDPNDPGNTSVPLGLHKVLTRISPKTSENCFESNASLVCGDASPTVTDTSGSASLGDCESTLCLTDTGFDDPLSYAYSYWSGPNGQVETDCVTGSIGQAYELTIIDKCCEEHHYDYRICPTKQVVNSYAPNADYTKWCRAIRCYEVDDILLENSCGQFSECIEPTKVEVSYEGGSCIIDYYYDQLLLGTSTEDPAVNNSYDEFSQTCSTVKLCNQAEVETLLVPSTSQIIVDESGTIPMCIKKYYCDYSAEPVFEQTQIATLGASNFNMVTSTCSTTVICFGETLEDPIELDPDINYNYNLTSSLCDRTAICNSVPYFMPSIIPIAPPSLWTWTEAFGCSSSVTCEIIEGPMAVEGEEAFSNWSYNTITNQCQADVSCQSTPVFGVTHSEFPTSSTQWQYNSAQSDNVACSRRYLCGQEWVTTTTGVDWVDSGTPCPSGTGTMSFAYCGGINTNVMSCYQSDDEVDSRERIEQQILVMPNPTTGVFELLNIDKDHVVKVFDSVGSPVECPKVEGNVYSIRLLPNGVYFVTVSLHGKQIAQQRIVKI